MNPTAPSKHTNGFYLQAVASFVISSLGLIIAVLYLDVTPWIRGFVVLGLFYLVTSTVTLSKVIRDREEANAVHNRIDAARLERVLAEFDPMGDMRPVGAAQTFSAPQPYTASESFTQPRNAPQLPNMIR